MNDAFHSVGTSLPGLTARRHQRELSDLPARFALRSETKLASEASRWNMATRSSFPCGSTAAACWRVLGNLAGPDQGIYAYWLNSWLRKQPQDHRLRRSQRGVRDCLNRAI